MGLLDGKAVIVTAVDTASVKLIAWGLRVKVEQP